VKLAPSHKNTKLTWRFGKMIGRKIGRLVPSRTGRISLLSVQQTVNLLDTPRWHHSSGERLVPTVRFAGRSSNPSLSLSLSLYWRYKHRRALCSPCMTKSNNTFQNIAELCLLSSVRFIAQQCLRYSWNFRWNCVCLRTKKIPAKHFDSTLIYAHLWFQ